MIPLDEVESHLATLTAAAPAPDDAAEILALGEAVLEHWVRARGETPTTDRQEGFRLLALHRQGARGMPSFNACRESCRELIYHYNLLKSEPVHPDAGRRARMMALLANHLCLFVGGKLQTERLGEFCCASKPVRAQSG